MTRTPSQPPSLGDMAHFEYRYLEARYADLLTPESKEAIRNVFEQQNAHMHGGLGDAACYARLFGWATSEMPALPRPRYGHPGVAGELLLKAAS